MPICLSFESKGSSQMHLKHGCHFSVRGDAAKPNLITLMLWKCACNRAFRSSRLHWLRCHAMRPIL